MRWATGVLVCVLLAAAGASAPPAFAATQTGQVPPTLTGRFPLTPTATPPAPAATPTAATTTATTATTTATTAPSRPAPSTHHASPSGHGLPLIWLLIVLAVGAAGAAVLVRRFAPSRGA